MENILFFLDSFKKLSANPRVELFSPLDLFEMKNVTKVIDSLVTFAEFASTKLPEGLKFKELGPDDLIFSPREVKNFGGKF